ncbi:activator-dependent family glycosyltransferase [Streptomyces sp. RK75]|nr:activator-dependent family glycosyltransferase [Streptomyces sp. RK75]
MRVLFVTFAWKTHFYPMVPLAWALQAAGHEVRVASEPELLDTVTEAGLTAVSVGPEETLEQRIRRTQEEGDLPKGPIVPPFSTESLYEIGGGNREGLPWEDITWLFDNVVVPRTRLLNDGMVDDLVAFSRAWQPDLVLCDVVTNAGAVAADVVGAVHGRLLFWLDLSLRMRRDFLRAKEQQPHAARPDALRDWYADWAQKYGSDFSEELVTGQFAINVLPEPYRLEPHEQTLSMRYVPYNGRSVVPPWLYEPPRAPRVLMTFGISARQLAELQVMSVEQVQGILGALADLDIELVLTLPEEARQQLDSVPDNTRIVDFVPFNVVAPTCSVVIHHGGAGNFNGTLLHGIPQLLVDSAVDAPAKRIVLEKTRAGLSVSPDEATGPRVREMLARLLGDGTFRAGAQRLQREALGQPTPGALVQELERLVAGDRESRPRP